MDLVDADRGGDFVSEDGSARGAGVGVDELAEMILCR